MGEKIIHTNYNGTRSIEDIEKYDIILQYAFSTQNAKIKDANGKRIQVTDLKLGDKIKVINIEELKDESIDLGSFPEELYNVKSIKVLKNE